MILGSFGSTGKCCRSRDHSDPRKMLSVKGSFGSPENAVGQGILRVHGEMLSVKESFGNKHLDHPGLALEHHAVIGAVNDSSVFFDNGFGIDKLKSVGLF